MTESPTVGIGSAVTTDSAPDAHSGLYKLADMLWPAEDFERWVDRRPGGQTGYLVLPSARRPRLLVPDDRRLIATGIARSSVGPSRAAVLARRFAARAAANGLIACYRSTASRVRPRSMSAAGLARYLSVKTGARTPRALRPAGLRPTEPEAGDPDG